MGNEKSVLFELLTKVDDLKKEIDAFHPLPVDVEERIMQKFRLDWNYNSNAIEGNALNYGETVAFLMHGITAHGKPLKDYLDIKGHNQAINYLLNFVRNKEELTEAVIRELHKTILVEPYEIDAVTADGKPTKRTVAIGTYKSQPNHVKTATGEMHYFATPEETPAKMQDLMTWYRKTREDKEVHPVVLAAFFHHRFVSIHPFDDGNGRMARLLMNLLLMQSNYPPVVIKTKDKNNYYLALSQSDAGNTSPFVEYVANTLIHSEEIYLKGARGESIDEPDDIDKEIVLLKKELNSRKDKFEKYNTPEVRLETYTKSFVPVGKAMEEIASKFNELFVEHEHYYYIYNDNYQSHQKSGRNRNINFSELQANLDISPQHPVNCIVATFCLNRYKLRSNTFSVSLSVEIVFFEFDFVIYTRVHELDTNIVSIKENNRLFEGQWLERISYESQLTDFQLKNASSIISKELISYIKQKANLNDA